MSDPVRRYRYGRFSGGPDPLAPPPDLRAALEEIGRDVMEGRSPDAALRELLRRGLPGQHGLDDLTQRLWRKRSELQRRHRLDGTLEQVKELLQRALTKERQALARDLDDNARFQEFQLDALPASPAGAVRELTEYDWRSGEAREAYQEIQRMLGQEALEQRFRGMSEALKATTPEDVARVREMLEDLSALLGQRAQGDPDIDAKFAEFMARHGEFFPENPRTVDELVDLLAARAAAAQRLLNSLSQQQRQELAQLSQQAFGDPRLAQALQQLDNQLRQLRPGQDWTGRGRFRGDTPLGMAEGAAALQDLAELDQLAEQLAQSYPGARLEDIDLDALARQLGRESTVDMRRLAELERQLRERGLLERAPDGELRLTPKAMRQLGDTALRDVLDQVRTRRGDRDNQAAGAAGELSGATRPWQFGDTEPWDVGRTVRNAVLRAAGQRERAVRLDVADVEVAETEHRSRAAVALCVDTSWSMVQDGRWLPMKRTALALHHLISTRFRADALQVITFGREAATMDIGELTALEGAWEQGTNLHHALLLAGRHLRRHPDAQPVVLVVTDGEPTAHLEPDGEAVFDYPPRPETLARTLAELDALARLGSNLTVFRLGEDPRLTRFVDLMARRSNGRVVAPDLDGLGAAVVSDYLRNRRSR
ncbi:VWA domain-containing protein [Crossiella sp. CA-258035]|uniref:vWA domain-containing protein n=1 Tax=Crossiella sp. CA-258035 TaxID=2981138 RepID=UPI0024BC6C02|nr:VWA domain-containing protein [Crossiella sp. CA-258035]WHT15823.1 VWA domain-containing protein [Crossiella sp. CA-258035]